MLHKETHKLHHRLAIKHPKRLSKDINLLLIESTLFTIANALSNTFVNVYLWKLKKDFLLIGWFNFYQFLAMMIIFIIAGKLSKSVDRVILLRIGVAVLTAFYLSVLFFGKHAVEYYFILGLVMGIGQGFYWFSFNILYFEITDRDNRDVFNGMNGLVTSFGSMAAPFLSGWFLSIHKGTTGYNYIFFISLVVFAIAVVMSFFFYKRQAKGKYQIGKVLSQIKNSHNWRNIFMAMIAQGGREGAVVFLIGLLVYISTDNEFSLGSYTSIVSGVSLITYYLVGRWIKREWRYKGMIIGSIMMSIFLVPLFIKTTYITLLVYGVGTSLFAPFYFIPLTSNVFDMIGESDSTANLRGEYIVIRELGLNIGRLITILAYLLLIKWIGKESIRYILLIAGSLPLVAAFMMKTVKEHT